MTDVPAPPPAEPELLVRAPFDRPADTSPVLPALVLVAALTVAAHLGLWWFLPAQASAPESPAAMVAVVMRRYDASGCTYRLGTATGPAASLRAAVALAARGLEANGYITASGYRDTSTGETYGVLAAERCGR